MGSKSSDWWSYSKRRRHTGYTEKCVKTGAELISQGVPRLAGAPEAKKREGRILL